MLASNSQVYTGLYLCLLSVEIKVVPTTARLNRQNYSNKQLIRYCQGQESRKELETTLMLSTMKATELPCVTNTVVVTTL